MMHEDKPLNILRHPLGGMALAQLRDAATEPVDFRRNVAVLARLLASEATQNIGTAKTTVTTPLDLTAQGVRITTKIVAIPVLRAGLGMLNGFLEVIPFADVGFIGLQRDETTLMPSEYYCKLPECGDTAIFLLDPMLATGGSAVKAIDSLAPLAPQSITLLTIIAAPEGVARVIAHHPDVQIYTAALDDGLNEHGYIVPGLGDAGDRLWGTR